MFVAYKIDTTLKDLFTVILVYLKKWIIFVKSMFKKYYHIYCI